MKNNYENNNLNRGRTAGAASNTEVINLMDIAKRLFISRNILVMIIAGLLVGIFSYVYSKCALPELYTSSVMVYVSNNSSIVINDGIDSQTITGSRSLAESSVIILKADYVMNEVGNRLLEIYSEDELAENFAFYNTETGDLRIIASSIASCFSIAPINETEVLQVTAVTRDPKLSADLCNILVDVAPDFLKGIVGGGTVEAIGEAQPALQKSSPNIKKNAAVGCLAGVVIAGGFFVLTILLDNKVRNSESFKSKFDFPVFEEIPYIENSEAKSNKKSLPIKLFEKGNTDVAENAEALQTFRLTERYNTLSNNLAVALAMNDEKVVVVSSPNESDGKSTVSLNLAKSMVKLEKKVLLIDLDLRKGSIYKKLKMPNKNGVIDIIGKDADFDRCIKKDKDSGLDILLTGGTTPNSMGILSSKKMERLINKCKERYDIVIIDSPPINVVGDACVISQYAAGMIIVARANKTRFEDVNTLIENVKLANGKIMGFVINFVEDSAAGYGYYANKKYGYGYYGDAEKEKKNTPADDAVQA